MIRRIFLYAVAGAGILAAGCARSPQVTFYTLVPGALHDAPRRDVASPSVTVGPVTLPEVVDRPQLVLRESDNRLKILETHRWGEPLKREIPRVLALNLGRLLGTDQVSSYPQNAGADAQYRVQVDVQRFEALPAQGVTVEALWTVKRASDGAQSEGHSLVQEKVAAGGYDAVVLAYGKALQRLSEEIARAVRSCYPAK